MTEPVNENHEQSLAHDIREFNKQIKAAAEIVRQTFRHYRNVIGKDEQHADKIFFASEMITKRLDVYDFHLNKGNINTSASTYRIHRVLVKLLRILEDRSRAKNLQTYLSESFTEVTSARMFETALFVVLENFIKYSPEKERVEVVIDDGNENCVVVKFAGFGPMCTEDEIGNVFDFRFRGRMARKLTGAGSGIGLHFAKEVCDLHGFTIRFSQDSSKSISRGGIDYHQTCVEIIMPK